MRVVLLTHVFPRAADDPLGAFLLHLTEGLGSRAEVCVVAPHAAGLAERENFGAIEVRRFRYAPDAQETLAYTGVMHEQVARGIGGKLAFARFCNAYFAAARAAVREWKPDIIHAHWWLPGGAVGAGVSKFFHTPLVITTHGTDVEQLRRAGWTRSLAHFAFGQARVVTCGSTYLRERLLELNVLDDSRVRVIPMPVNPFFVESHPVPPPAPASFKLLCVARLTRQKSLDTLIEAVALLRDRGQSACVTIVGDGDQRAVLEEQVRALHLESAVEFLGMRPQTELPNLYRTASVLVLPSVREGMGLVLAEALLCGVPVIATNSGGVTDIVRDGETGLLFPERDAPALATASQKYANDPVYAAQLAQNGRAFVLNNYAPQPVAAQFLQVYADALAA